MNIHFKFAISLFALIPLFSPSQIEYIDALDFDNDSLEQNLLPYINTLKNENYKKQKINFANTIDTNAEIEYISKTATTKEDNGNLDQSTTKKQEEKNIVSENISVYEGLGIKLENFTPWTILTKSDKSTCYDIDLCFINLGIINGTNIPTIWIIQDNLKSQTIKEYCKCNTLEDYERHFYTNMISKFDKFSIINENETTFQGDRAAIQLEYKFTPKDIQIHTYTVFTNNSNPILNKK
jgi:hypothetical protein